MPDEFRYSTLMALGANYNNQKNLSAALDAYRQAEAISPESLTSSAAAIMAQVALGLGDKKQAIQYYDKAINIARSDDDSFNDAYIEIYQQSIEKIKEQGE